MIKVNILKTVIAAAAIFALPMMASAVPLNQGGTTTISLGNAYDYSVSNLSGAGASTFTLQATPPSQLALATEFTTLEFTGIFQNLLIQLTTDVGIVNATAAGTTSSSQLFDLSTIFNSVNGFVQTLTISWSGIGTSAGSSPTAGFIIQASPSQVPVPAAGLLLLGALGGVAALRRRRKAVAA